MNDAPSPEGTFLTDRQAEVLALREAGLTQAEIADRLGTTVSNVSAVESAARDNVAKARRTVAAARILACAVRFEVPGGTDLRDLIDRVYEAGDDAGLTVTYTEPELSTHLQEGLRDRLEGRELTDAVGIGITADGDVHTYPAGFEDVVEDAG